MQEKLLIIDANALFHRAYHALPPLSTKEGQPIGGVYGFLQILFKALEDIGPDYIAIAFDYPAKTFRHEMYTAYKATRQKADDDLVCQFPILREVITSLGFPIYEMAGYEADDVVGSLARCAKTEDLFSYILTGDQDEIQLVDETTNVYTMRRGFSDTILYDVKMVNQKFGFGPKEIVSYKALKGDPSDNIPGVPGIGEKTASQLIISYGSLSGIYDALDSGELIATDRVKNTLTLNKEKAFLSYKLAHIKTDLSLCYDKKHGKIEGKSSKNATNVLLKYDLKSVLDRLPKIFKEPTNDNFDQINFTSTLVSSEIELDQLLKKAEKFDVWAIDTETEILDRVSPKFLGLSLCFDEKDAYFIKPNPDLTQSSLVKKIKPFLEDEKIRKIGHNIKYDLCVFRSLGIEVKNVYFDTMIAAYLLNPGERRYSLDELSLKELSFKKISIEQLTGKKGAKITLKDVSVQDLTAYASEDAMITFLLYKKYEPLIMESDLEHVFKKIEMPLVNVLVDMEKEGIRLDSAILNDYSAVLSSRIEVLTEEIFLSAGKRFNLNSPAQLKEVLFEDMGLEAKKSGIKKVKSGGYSTAAGELEKLKGVHPVVEKVLEYRELVKLKSTYVDALPELVNPNTGRIHTNYNQTIAITGRLSSTEPNLQSIPIRTNLGRPIRSAFVADSGFSLIAADYSQMELRIIAHLSQDKEMVRVFREGGDIHTKTASQIFSKDPRDVSGEDRRVAKTINFGIVYGISPHGIATSLGVNHDEAKRYLEVFFDTYRGVKVYMEKTINEVKKSRVVSTSFGRRRSLPEIQSTNSMIRAGAERMAINYPVQGLAADYIKLAMISVSDCLKDYPYAKMLLQVHDELVFEVKKGKEDDCSMIIKEVMEKTINISVPVVVNIKKGSSWGFLEGAI